MGAYGLTRRENDLLRFIQSYHAENGLFPTLEEMKEGMGLASKSNIHFMLTALEERGHIVRLKHLSRAMRLTEAPVEIDHLTIAELSALKQRVTARLVALS